MRWAGLSALVLVATIALGCGPTAPREGTTPRPIGTLHAPGHYARELTIDQQVTAEYGSSSETFRAVLEKRGDRLVMVGLGPHGGRAFVLTQEGERVDWESEMPRELPFPPEFMLMDIHRAWLGGLPREGGAPLADGEHEQVVDGENVREVWEGGRLLSRSFHILTSNQAYWSVDITYEGGLGGGTLPTRIVIDEAPTATQRYRLVLTSLSGSVDDAPAAAPEAPAADGSEREAP